jgi:hypothetical protein
MEKNRNGMKVGTRVNVMAVEGLGQRNREFVEATTSQEPAQESHQGRI